MLEEMKGNPQLVEEYENIFDSEEKISNSLKITKDSFTIDIGVIEFDSLLIPESLKKGRKETYMGLSTSIAELGILTPIHVMITESYSSFVEENPDEEYDGFKYVLVDGFRRVFSGYKNNLKRCNAIIWDFKDKAKGSELLQTLSLVLNRAQKRSWGEIWYLYQVLETQSVMTPGTLEYLLQLEPGDAMKLQDIMKSDYPEVRDELLSNKKTLLQCYNMLQKLRKEEDQLQKDDLTGISDVEQAEGVVDKANNEDDRLSNENVKELLEMEDSFDGDLSEDEFDELMGNNLEADRFEVDGDRHLDPKLRAAVLQRDNYQCQVTGFGEGLPTEVALAILQVHHKVPVADGGTNEMDNLITISQDPHTLVHVIQRRQGRLGMSKEDFLKLPDNMQEYIKKVMKLARIAVEADKRCGKTKEQIKKETSGMHYQMPGVILSKNLEAIKSAKEDSKSE